MGQKARPNSAIFGPSARLALTQSRNVPYFFAVISRAAIGIAIDKTWVDPYERAFSLSVVSRAGSSQ